MVTQQPITLRDVARAAEVRGHEAISRTRGLKLNRTFQVGFVLPDLTSPLFPSMVRGLEDGLHAAKSTVVIANTDDDEVKERSVLDAMRRRRVDGLVLATARRQDAAIDGLRETGMPLVLVNRTTEDGRVPSVTGDDHAGIGMSLRHLVELGHRRIAYVGAPTTVSTGFAREQAFVSWARSEGIEVDTDLMVSAAGFHEDPGADAFRALLARDVSFTAVVAANDLIALGCLDVAAELLLETIEQLTGTADAIRLRPEPIVRGSTQEPAS